jgi:hypothetical protein
MYLKLKTGEQWYFASLDVMFWWMNKHLDKVTNGYIYNMSAKVNSEWLDKKLFKEIGVE